MELTLDQALQKGVEAHKAGKAQEADQYYTAILKADPKHPDANHNMGVLAVGVGKVEEALPFFKTALEVNPSIPQYWLSYIDALIRLDRVDEARAVLDQAKQHGVEQSALAQIELKLNNSPVVVINQTQKDIPQEPNILDEIKLDKALKLANKRIKDGLSEEAKKIYQDILKKFPKNKRAHEGLKGLYGKQIRKAFKVQDPPEDQQDSLIKLYNKGHLRQVLDKASQLLKEFPDSVFLYNIKGVGYRGLGQIDAAINSYKKALSIKSDYAEAFYNMGNALRDQGKLEEAIEAYNKAISIKPDYAEAFYNIGVTLKDQEKLDEAIQGYNKAISIKPDYAEAHNNVGAALQDQGKLDDAIEAYNKAILIKPDSAEAYNNKGNTLQDQGKFEEAIKAYNKAISIKPDSADAYNNKGNALQDQGKPGEAIEAYNKAISIIPDYAEAHRNLSVIKTYIEEDDHFIQVQELYKQEDLSEDAQCHLSFALAKMYDDIGDIDNSFASLTRGNKLRKKLLNYSIDQDKILFSRLKRIQPKLLKNSLAIKESPTDPTPIFILGMPRSGTTLVEQIISAHSKVFGAGELENVIRFGFKLATGPAQFSTVAISEFREDYLSELSNLSNGKQFITDKMPQNFYYIPLICAAFPEAKIIHVERNPVATCWSNYKQYFSSKGLGYCCDLRDLVTFYGLYKELMKLWNSEYDDRIYNLNYEELTTDQENQTRKLITHLNLPWENACLSPHKNKRSVRTASQQQVRQEVYKGSSEAWRKYEPYLNGAFDNFV